MGSSLDYVATRLLVSAIESHFLLINPDLDLEARFYVHQSDFGSNDYIIEDLDLELQTRISKKWLEEPTFELVPWYLQYLESEHQYSARYKDKQIELYYLDGRPRVRSDLEYTSAESDDEGSIMELGEPPDSHLPEGQRSCHHCEEDHSYMSCLPDLEIVSDTSGYSKI